MGDLLGEHISNRLGHPCDSAQNLTSVTGSAHDGHECSFIIGVAWFPQGPEWRNAAKYLQRRLLSMGHWLRAIYFLPSVESRA